MHTVYVYMYMYMYMHVRYMCTSYGYICKVLIYRGLNIFNLRHACTYMSGYDASFYVC